MPTRTFLFSSFKCFLCFLEVHHYQFVVTLWPVLGPPRVFIEVLALVLGLLKTKGILIVGYLGDWRLREQSAQELTTNLQQKGIGSREVQLGY